MNHVHRFAIAASVLFLIHAPGAAIAQSGPGAITGVLVSGPADPDHPDVVQISLSGGYSEPGCDASLNAIRNTPQNRELIALAMLVYLSGNPVYITLDPTDTYYPGRCAIVRIDAR